MPTLAIAGDIASPDFHCMRVVAEELCKLDNGLHLSSTALLEADWTVHIAGKIQELKGQARLLEHGAQPIAIHSVLGYLGGVQSFHSWVQRTYPSYRDVRSKTDYTSIARQQFQQYIVSSPNAFCYFDLQTGSDLTGRVIFELFTEKCPNTVQNFVKLCTGECGKSSSGVSLHYRSSPVHRIVKDAWVQGGDIVNGSGASGTSVFGNTFADESYTALKHDAPGILGMANTGPHSNHSQWYITLRPLPYLDNKYVAFGRVIAGMSTIRQINELDTRNERPATAVVITSCNRFAG